MVFTLALSGIYGPGRGCGVVGRVEEIAGDIFMAYYSNLRTVFLI